MDCNFTDVSYEIPKKILFEEWLSSSSKNREYRIVLKIKSFLNLKEDISEENMNCLKEKSHLFCLKLEEMWKKCNRTRSRMEKNHARWLDGTLTISLKTKIVASTSEVSTSKSQMFDWYYDIINSSRLYFNVAYICMPLLAGELGKVYGPKWFLVGAMVINSAGCMLTPVMAESFGSHGVMAIRIIQGMCQGFFFPCVYTILGKWVPKEERSTLANFIFTSVAFGTIFATFITQWVKTMWVGWPLGFYFFGIVGIVWCVIWAIYGANSPREHKYISEQEQLYIQTSLNNMENKPVPPTPWTKILTSMPVWAIIVANLGQIWGNTRMLEKISILRVFPSANLSQSLFVYIMPCLVIIVSGLCFGPMTDWLIAQKKLTPVQTRKLMNSIGSIGPVMALVLLGFIKIDNIGAMMTILIMAVGINSAIWSGFQVNHFDLSPKFSGILMAIGDTLSYIFLIIAEKYINFTITDVSDIIEWRFCLILAAVYMASDIFYVIFAQVDLQPWDTVANERNDVNSSNTQ